MKRVLRAIPVLLILLVIGYLAFRYVQSKERENPGAVRVSGNIEITDVELSFRIPGWVERRLVDEGETVKIGQEIARLDRTELSQEVEQRKADCAAARSALAELEAGSRPEEIQQAEAAARRAKAALDELLAGSRPQEIAVAQATAKAGAVEEERLKLDFDRITRLHKSAAATNQEFDTAKAAWESSVERRKEADERVKLALEGPRKEQIDQARESLKQLESALELVRKGPRKERIDQARARLQQQQQAQAICETRLGYSILVSPVSGLVLSKNVESGEYVVAGTPIVTVGDLSKVWVRVYVNESDLGQVKVGQKVRVSTDTYPGKIYEGQVSFISSSAEFTPRNVQTKKERVKLVYRVKVNIPNTNMELKPGMPADAEINVES